MRNFAATLLLYAKNIRGETYRFMETAGRADCMSADGVGGDAGTTLGCGGRCAGRWSGAIRHGAV